MVEVEEIACGGRHLHCHAGAILPQVFGKDIQQESVHLSE